MYTTVLVGKLKRCNSRIYLKNTGLEYEGVKLAGIWLKKPREFKAKGRTIVKGAEWLEAVATGHADVMLSNVSVPEVPEYETLALKGGIQRKGWRAIVRDCVGKGAFSWEQAKKVFGSGIGDSDWDRLDSGGKELALTREAKQMNWRVSKF